MAVLKIRIPDGELAWLDALARTQGTTKAEIVRSALRSVFEENFLEKKTILLPEDQYQALVDLVGTPLRQLEIEGRKRLQKVSDWNLCGGSVGRCSCVRQSLPGSWFLSRLGKLSSDGFFPIFRSGWRNIRVIDIFVSDVFESLELLCSPRFGIRKFKTYGCHRLFLTAFTALTVLNCLMQVCSVF